MTCVVLSRTVYADYTKMLGQNKALKSRVLLADDGPLFVNVLELFKHSKLPVIRRRRVTRAMDCHVALQELLTESIHEPRHFEKLKWFAGYWYSVLKNGPEGPPQVVLPASGVL